ncbi:MAG: Cytochrome c oxidase subunit 4 [Thelocarpon impressellum]|nr:MAG: Cytochrome c oxidase subunit 4 [Thelocarpon impressellum]
MFLQRSAVALARRTAVKPALARGFTTSLVRRNAMPDDARVADNKQLKKFDEVKTETDLLPPGAPSGVVPTDLEQATGLERLEILGKMQSVDIFDMKPLDASRKGSLEKPIVVKSFGDEQYIGCTGAPADSHVTIWLTTSRSRPIERCPECGSVYKMQYVGPQDAAHDHHHEDGAHNHEEPKTFADFVRPEYTY